MKCGVALVALLVLFSGCTTPSADQALDEEEPPMPAVERIENIASGCLETILFMPISKDHARSLLPDGYVPRDLGPFFGLPADTERAGVVVPTFTCADSTWEESSLDWGFLGVFIEPRSETDPPVDLEFYMVSYLSAGERQAEDLGRIGHAMQPVDITIEDGAGQTLETTVTDPDGTLLTFTTVPSGIDEPFASSLRLWHETPTGRVTWTADATAIEHKGTTPECQARAGSIIAMSLGRTDCTDGAALGFVHRDLKSSGWFTYTPHPSG